MRMGLPLGPRLSGTLPTCTLQHRYETTGANIVMFTLISWSYSVCSTAASLFFHAGDLHLLSIRFLVQFLCPPLKLGECPPQTGCATSHLGVGGISHAIGQH